MKKSLTTLVLIAGFAVNAANAHGVQQQPSLLGALLSVGNHGSIANVGATVAAPSALANVRANVLGAVKANVDVGQTGRHDSSLLNLNASVLSGGVGNRQDRW